MWTHQLFNLCLCQFPKKETILFQFKNHSSFELAHFVQWFYDLLAQGKDISEFFLVLGVIVTYCDDKAKVEIGSEIQLIIMIKRQNITHETVLPILKNQIIKTIIVLTKKVQY